MFRLFRKPTPKIHPESVRLFSERRLEEILQEAEKYYRADGNVNIAWTQMMLANVELVNLWRQHYYPGINKALEAPDIPSQRIAVREFLLNTIEEAALPRAFLWTGMNADRIRSVDESTILMKLWSADAINIEDATFRHLTYLTITDCSIEMTRRLQGFIPQFDDNHPDDYFEHFKKLTTQIWFIIAENNLAISSGRGNSWMEPFRVPLKNKLDQVRDTVLTGADIRYQPSDELTSEELSEPDFDQVPDLTIGQVDSLVDALVRRVQYLGQGELYLLNHQPPTDIAAAYSVETAMMLIGLRECAGDDLIAEGALRTIMFRVQQKKLRPDERANSPTSIDISFQKRIAELANDKQDEGWMTPVVLVAAAVMHPEAYANNQGSPESRRAWGAACVPLLHEIWTPYATTLRCLGKTVPEKFLD